MVRLNPLILVMIVANLAVFFAAGQIRFIGDIAEVQQKCQDLEKKLPQLKELYEWAIAAKAGIEAPPTAEAGQLLGKWNQMATRLGLEVREAAQIAGRVPEIKLAGSGSFNAISTILNSVASEKAALVKRVGFEKTGGSAWDFEVAVAVRNGPWEYFPTQEKRPVPENLPERLMTLSSSKPFATQAVVPVKALTIKEQIRYIGYFSGDKTPVVIVEIAGKFEVLKCGDVTPGGTIVKAANVEELQLLAKDNDGKETTWTVKMEKK